MTRQELLLKPLTETLESEEYLPLAKMITENLPEYIFHVPAASSGKYHNKNELGDFGLCRHQIGTLKIMNHLLSLDQYNREFSENERDLLRISALFHDGMKSGTQEDYEQNPQTKFNHPELMSNFVREITHGYDSRDTDFVCENIRSHMGQWNTSKKYPEIVLPTPITLAQELTHLSDYFASRTDITIAFEPEYFPEPDIADIKKRLVERCKDLIENGIPREKILEVFERNNDGKKNPNSVQSYAIAAIIMNTLSVMEKADE